MKNSSTRTQFIATYFILLVVCFYQSLLINKSTKTLSKLLGVKRKTNNFSSLFYGFIKFLTQLCIYDDFIVCNEYFIESLINTFLAKYNKYTFRFYLPFLVYENLKLEDINLIIIFSLFLYCIIICYSLNIRT